MWYLYILRLDDDSLYTGVTKNIQRRLKQHRNGNGSKYVCSRLPLELVHKEKHETKGGALRRESQIKSLPKPKKEDLVEQSELQ